MLCNAKFCVAHDGQSDVVNHVKKKSKLVVQKKASLSTKNISKMEKQLSLVAQEATFAYHYCGA
jgi:hypothetical protein